jgi:hypothetical protein
MSGNSSKRQWARHIDEVIITIRRSRALGKETHECPGVWKRMKTLTEDAREEPQGAGEAAHCAPQVMNTTLVRHLGGNHYGKGYVGVSGVRWVGRNYEMGLDVHSQMGLSRQVGRMCIMEFGISVVLTDSYRRCNSKRTQWEGKGEPDPITNGRYPPSVDQRVPVSSDARRMV